ncbi:MAG: hypothetical protein U1C72_00885, partial [Candidatus Pacearchaeota archaeon]|nr:hypothetical protein [Candidatus Pacearchaeota archaeon]
MELPPAVRDLPSDEQGVWMATYNREHDKGGTEAECAQAAWGAVKAMRRNKMGTPKEKKDISVDMGRFQEDVVLESEATENPDIIKGAVFVQAGFNKARIRFYPEETLREAVPLLENVKQYADHSNGDRSVRDWWSTITEAWYDEDMKALRGNVAVHSPLLREVLGNTVARHAIGLSIDASGLQESAEVEGELANVVKQIERFHSVDWVTEAGAGGRVTESQGTDHQRGDSSESMPEEGQMDWDNITEGELRENRPDLITAISDRAVGPVKEQLAESNKLLAERILEGDQDLIKVSRERIRDQ